MAKYSPLDGSDSPLAESFPNSKSNTDSEDNIKEAIRGLGDREHSWLRRHARSVSFNIVLIIINIVFCLVFTIWTAEKYSHGPQHSQSPARHAIEYTSHQFELAPVFQHDGTLNPEKPTNFNGQPRVELDDAWTNLTYYQNIRVKQEELGQFAGDESLVKLSDGSGYYATTAVFHGLHCIKRVHHFIYRDSYYDDISDEEARLLQLHTEHCIDWLRQYVQCNADTTLMPLHWSSNDPFPLAKDDGSHQCVNWNLLDQWMKERSIDVFQPGLIMHPLYGNPFGANKKGDKIGITDGKNLVHGGMIV